MWLGQVKCHNCQVIANIHYQTYETSSREFIVCGHVTEKQCVYIYDQS